MNLKYFSKLAKASPVNQQVHGYNWVNIWGKLIKAIVCVHGLEKHFERKNNSIYVNQTKEENFNHKS